MLVTILERLKQISSDLTFEAYSDEDDKENYNNQNQRGNSSNFSQSNLSSVYFKKVLKFDKVSTPIPNDSPMTYSMFKEKRNCWANLQTNS